MNKVLILNQFALPRDQGGGTRHVDLFGRLPRWSSVILAGNRNHYSQLSFTTSDERFRLLRVPSSNGGAMSRLRSWLSYTAKAISVGLSERNVSVVYASSPHLLAPVAGRIIATVKRVPYVLEVRDLWPESLVAAGALRRGSFMYEVLAALERSVARTAAAVVVVTPGWEEHFEAMGVPLAKLKIVPNGTEVSDFQVYERREQLREGYNIHGYTAVFAGAHGPKDGLSHILQAARQCPDVNFLLVGSGPAKAAAISEARERRLLNVEFRDPIRKSELPRLLAACDVGIHAITPLDVFDKGMSPNKLFDYLASGLPVVSNARKALAHVAVDGQCGRLGDVEDLAWAIRSVMDADNETKAAWRAEAYRLMTTTYSRSNVAERLAQVLEDVVHVAPAAKGAVITSRRTRA